MSSVAEAVRKELSVDEAVKLAAVDGVFYSHFFFPNTTRQDSPGFHRVMWNVLENPARRCVNFKIFRGGAKTTLMRLFLSKRVAYGISRTIIIVGKSQEHAAYTIDWLMKQVEYNEEWAQCFGLRKGSKWTQTDCEILHTKFGVRVRIMALGITGSTRGINIEDYRPDLILVDDPCDDENTATPEQREKMARLLLGAIKESLVPASEDPSAKLVLTQTPLDEEDLTNMCEKSSEFFTMTVGCLTSEDFDEAESSWPSRWTKEELLAEHQAFADINQLSIWWREKMCRIVSRETSIFSPEWLSDNFWVTLPPMARYVAGIDPTPVLSDQARAKGEAVKTDQQALMVKAYWKNHKYIVEYTTARDEDPDHVSVNLDRLANKYPILRCGVEDVAYQRTLKWYLEREMRAGRCKSLHVLEIPTGQLSKSKFHRITQAHAGPGSQGLIHCHASHIEFIDQWNRYPNVKYKDLLDVSAICDATVSPRSAGMQDIADYVDIDESLIPDLEEIARRQGVDYDWRGAP